jgi:hypothetical protein
MGVFLDLTPKSDRRVDHEFQRRIVIGLKACIFEMQHAPPGMIQPGDAFRIVSPAIYRPLRDLDPVLFVP